MTNQKLDIVMRDETDLHYSKVAAQENVEKLNEDSNSNSQDKWGDFYLNDDEYAMAEPGSEPESDSDFEYEGRSRRGKGKKSMMKTRPSRSSRSSRRIEEEMMRTPVSDSKCQIVRQYTF